jgi:hypothetical protein
MKSLQDKYTRNKARKLTVLETHKRSSISTNECLTSHNNSETVCDNNNCDKSSRLYLCANISLCFLIFSWIDKICNSQTFRVSFSSFSDVSFNMFLILLSPPPLDPKFSVHFKLHAQLQTQENAWMNEMKSLQDKYTRNKTRKLTVLETHKRSSISTNECLTSHNNSETVY